MLRTKYIYKKLVVAISFLLLSMVLYSQGVYVNKGDIAFAEGLYSQALEYYKKALKQNKSNVNIMYKAAESARLSNEYKQAIVYYTMLKETTGGTSVYPDAIYYLAKMYRHDGGYDSAMVYYNMYMEQRKFKALTFEQQAVQELESSKWAIKSDKDTGIEVRYVVDNFGKQVNTKLNESGAMDVDSVILFSRTTPVKESESKNAMFSDYIITQVYQTRYLKNGKLSKATLNEWGLNNIKKNSGNVAYDSASQTIFFTFCDADHVNGGNLCEIYKTKRINKKWTQPEKVGSDVNIPGYTSTQPTIGYTDGKMLLYYVSNRPGGNGGMDIWYVVVDSNYIGKSVNLGKPVNSVGNEITPYYSNKTNSLYFSSDWHYGYGGYDIFVSKGGRDQWSRPKNMGRPINTSANDLYFYVNYSDTNNGFLTSNREGSFFTPGNTCCNDIYKWQIKIDTICPCEKNKKTIRFVPINISLQQQARMLIPISLYFHNDEPNPKSTSPKTTLTYSYTYQSYIAKQNDYIAIHNAVGDSVEVQRVKDFFADSVVSNYSSLKSFIEVLQSDLMIGSKVKLVIKGYASPLHTGEYNYILSQRRISSFVNQLQQTDSSHILIQGLESNNLTIEEVPFGSSKAMKNVSSSISDLRRSVYGVDAALERKIEILDYLYFDATSDSLFANENSLNFFIGEMKKDTINDVVLAFTLKYDKVCELDFVSVDASNIEAAVMPEKPEGYNFTLHISINTYNMTIGSQAIVPLEFRIKGQRHTMKCMISYSVVE